MHCCCRVVETVSTVSTKYAILSEKHEWDSRQYRRVNAYAHLLRSNRDKSSGSWTSFTLCQTLLCQQFSVADFPSPRAFHFRPAGKVIERINLILQRKFSPLLVSLTKNLRPVYITLTPRHFILLKPYKRCQNPS